MPPAKHHNLNLENKKFKLNESEQTTVLLLLGALDLPLDLKFGRCEAHTKNQHEVGALGDGFEISIRTGKYSPGEFWLIVKSPQETDGLVCEVRIRGKIDESKLQLSTDYPSFAYLQAPNQEQKPYYKIDMNEDIGKGLLTGDFEGQKYEPPKELKGVTNRSAANRLFKLTRNMLQHNL